MKSATIIPATKRHRRVLRALFELYAHDFSPITGADVDDQGAFTDKDFPSLGGGVAVMRFILSC